MNWIFSDNINTDLITPGRYNITTEAKELAKIAFIEYRPDFAKKVKAGDYIIAGRNFGCGSSRETAAMALKACGIKTIIAKSFGRIFYRNCLNQGLLAVIANNEGLQERDRLELDFENQLIINKTKEQLIPADIPELMIKLNKAGGIIPYLQRNGLGALSELFVKTEEKYAK